MKQRKVFIGIMVPQEVAKRLARLTEPWRPLPIRFVKERNLHVTLAFLGHLSDESVAEVCERVKEVCAAAVPFDVLLERIALMPEPGVAARMLWYAGDASEELRALHDDLGRALGTFVASSKAFAPHVTLGRVRERAWRALTDHPDLKARFTAAISVDLVTVFESVFEPGEGLVYRPLGEYPLEGGMDGSA